MFVPGAAGGRHRAPKPPKEKAMSRYAKALIGALVAGLGTLGTALADDHVTGQEVVTVVVATLVALGAVWSVPNRPDTP
jgi:hypothetical protein